MTVLKIERALDGLEKVIEKSLARNASLMARGLPPFGAFKGWVVV